MAGAGYKTFTAGEVLTASDVNTYLMQQSVQNYGGTAARASAIPTPSTGMVSYIGDDGNGVSQIQAYNGSSWNNMGGLVLVKTQTIGTGVSSVTVPSAFSATYDNYRIVVSGVVASTSDQEVLITVNGTTGLNYTGGYVALNFTTSAVSGVGTGGNTGTSVFLTSTGGSGWVADILNPYVSTTKTYFNSANSSSGAAYIIVGASGATLNSTSSTSFTLTPGSGTLTGGTIYVYGYRKA